MSWRKLAEDSIAAGIIVGLVLLFSFYVLLEWIRKLIISIYEIPYFFSAPRTALLAVLLNMLCFRMLMIRFEKEKTAKGVLLSTVSSVLVYLFYFHKQN